MGGLRTMVLLAAVAVLLTPDLVQSDCASDSLDIVFLLDTSNGTVSSRSPYFDKEKEFCKDTISSLENGKNNFGMITFAEDQTEQFSLGSMSSLSEISLAVDTMWISIGKADVVTSLSYAIENGFGNGDRRDASNILILLTHTGFNNASAISDLSKKLKDSRIELITVQVGISDSQYSRLSDFRHLGIEVSGISGLHDAIRAIASFACKGHGVHVLQPWQPWTQCGVTCGTGLRRRFRKCVKHSVTDYDCEGPLMEQARCAAAKCTAPLDGGWSYWDSWSACSKTCGGGIRTKRRSCSFPAPQNGGLACPGPSSQTETCSDWNCPDCSKTCPPGGRLSKECDICECFNAVLFGTVTDDEHLPLNDASIFVTSKMYERLTGTNYKGYFFAFGVCLMNEKVEIRMEGYGPATVFPAAINATHWTVNVSLPQYDAPTFIRQPESKVRMTGQSVTLCCEAFGTPLPTTYQWFKNDRPLNNAGSTGSLKLSALKAGNAGDYHCQADTAAGSGSSEVATLKVTGGNIDSCGDPKPQSEILPSGCFVTGDTSRNETIDVGTCGQKPCVSRSMVDNGTCSDWWPHYCCDAKNTEKISISCDGFSYETTRIISCQCTLCLSTTTLSGKVFGRLDNGTELPMKYGSIYVQDERVTMTNMVGYFSFDVPNKLERIILDIRDEITHTFVDTTKIVTLSQGEDTSITIPLPLRPPPINFNTHLGLDVPLGASSGLPSVASLSIADNSILTEDGKPFHGRAKAMIKFVDPRKIEDIQAANGQFSCEIDGKRSPLETYGMFALKVEDDNGKSLHVNKPIRFEMDSSIFNVSLDRDGEPDVAMWQYDKNKGVWKEMAKMHFSTAGNGRRRLLTQLVAGMYNPATIKPIQHVKQVPKYGPVVVGWHWSNCDKNTKVYDYQRGVVSRDQVVEQGACFVSVTVYKDMTFKDPAGKNIQVYAVTKELGGSKFKGIDSASTDDNGHVCLAIFCNSEVYLYGEKDGSRLQASVSHDIPVWYTSQNNRNNTEVKFTSMNVGEYIDPKTSMRRYSPVYYYQDSARCIANTKTGAKFQFAQPVRQPKLNLNVPLNVNDNKFSWYPVPANYPTRWTCYMKVLIKVRDNYDLRVLGTSNMYFSSGNQGSYGTHDVGPIPAPDNSDLETRAACVQYRCPGLVHGDGGKDIHDVSTLLEVRLNKRLPCKFKILKSGINVTQLTDSRGIKGFQFFAESNNNYGPKYGVFMTTNKDSEVRSFCYSGTDDGTLGYDMKPTSNAAVSLDCT